ncbi:MAG: FkbM family methyltransferase [Thiotrichales bacterium]
MFSDVLLDREYDLPLSPPAKFIVDAGANVGYTSLFMATRHPAAKIVSIEPEESNFLQLQQNVHHLPHVTPLKQGLWPREAYLYIENPDDVNSGFRLAESAMPRPGAIRATTIPALMRELKGPG